LSRLVTASAALESGAGTASLQGDKPELCELPCVFSTRPGDLKRQDRAFPVPQRRLHRADHTSFYHFYGE